ncbi:Vitamin K-dependent gamma-carboxylase [Halovivax ruber XH-70]|uniref:Vitamin K-dependent gamma-carboxylase n=1 Tax=Halovivax ruber (strain DSM 18193 / JCM 13892 / XH-70) TaxID=797302 RepID=L0I9L2_HALRX|nr:HTTM domain-containing protein [Halovivax ruber]AGB15394.1 Vitamin K-dependent gamma-carboxylase [Halovivax ruber XH-70]
MAGSKLERMAGTIGDDTTAATALARLRTRLGMDVRAIASFRIGLGLVALFDLLALRLPGLVTFYTDRGVLSRAALAEVSPTLAQWSLHAQSGAAWFQGLLLGVTVLAAVCVLVGYRSRVAAVLLAGLLASMHARNPYLVNGGDTILISLCLFGAALPLDARWAIRPRGNWTTERIVSTGTAVLSLHVVSIYAINALLKLQSDAWMRGDAVPRIFQLEDFTFLLGPTLSAHPSVLTGVNWLWVVTISVAVGLVVLTGWARLAVVAAFVCAHLGMAMTLRLGAFPFIMCVALVPFLPPLAWNRVERTLAVQHLPSRLSAFARATGFEPRGTNMRPVVPASIQRRLEVAGTLALVGAFVAVFGWQVAAADLTDPSAVDDGPFEGASWEFFAPDPPSSYSWYVAEADRDGGESIDLVDGGPAAFDRPPDAMDRYPSTLWKRYGSKGKGSGPAVAESAARYACGQAPATVESVTLYRVDQPVDESGPVGEPVVDRLASYTCD